MKLSPKFLITIITICSAFNNLKAQDTLTFDCKANNFNPHILNYIYLREGRVVTIKYINVNPFLVTSNATITGVNRNDSDGIGYLTSLMAASNFIKSKDSTTHSQFLLAIKKAFIIQPNKILTKKEKEEALLVKETDSLLKLKMKLIDQILLGTNQIKSAQVSINTIFLLDTIIINTLKDPSLSSSAEFVQRIKDVSPVSFTTIADINTFYKTFTDQIETELISLQTNLIGLKEINNQLNDKNPEYAFDDYIETFSTSIDKLQNTYSANNLMQMQKQVIGITLNYQKGTNSEYVVYSDKVFQVKNDVEIFQDSLKLPNNKPYKIIGPIDIHSYGGTRIDFSLGFATTFGKINGTDYFLIKDAKDSATGIGSSTKNKKFDFTPVAFIHMMFKLKSPLSVGISLGLNPDFSSLTNSKMLLGFSVAGMQSNSLLKRLLLTGGIGIAVTNVLKPRLENIPSALLKSLTDADLTTTAIRAGGFIALSFNLGQTK